jgi:hypothetical protein
MSRFSDWIKQEVPVLVQKMMEGEGDHLGAFHYPQFQYEGFATLHMDALQNNPTNGYIGIAIKTEKYGPDHSKLDVPANIETEFVQTLTEIGLEPVMGWHFEGGVRYITNKRTTARPWSSEWCTQHRHFVLVKGDVFKDGGEHVIRP